MIELKPCPFCGSEKVQYGNTYLVWNSWYIRCCSCGCRTDALYESADYSVKEKLAEAWNERAEAKKNLTLYGYDIEQLVLFAECCKEVGITNDDLKNVEDCCRLAIDATEKAMVEAFKKSYERFEIWKK